MLELFLKHEIDKMLATENKNDETLSDFWCFEKMQDHDWDVWGFSNIRLYYFLTLTEFVAFSV